MLLAVLRNFLIAPSVKHARKCHFKNLREMFGDTQNCIKSIPEGCVCLPSSVLLAVFRNFKIAPSVKHARECHFTLQTGGRSLETPSQVSPSAGLSSSVLLDVLNHFKIAPCVKHARGCHFKNRRETFGGHPGPCPVSPSRLCARASLLLCYLLSSSSSLC